MKLCQNNVVLYVLTDVLIIYCSLRKVKMDQRKLMDNANTVTDMAKVSFSTTQ